MTTPHHLADVHTAHADEPTQNADAPSNPPANPSVAAAAIFNNPETNAAMAIVGPSSKVLTLQMIVGLNVSDLRKACRRKGLKVAGNKQDLVDRLLKAVRKGIPSDAQEEHRARRPVLDDRSLAVGGSMSVRLHATVTHWPRPTKPRTRCQMHRWLGIEAKNGVMHCKTCNVALCIFCYEPFHTYPMLTEIKGDLKKAYTEEWAKIKHTGAKNKN
jgi:hypothetical protein